MESTFVTEALKAVRTATTVTTKGSPLVVLVDGDLIAYRAAAATQGTFYRIGKKGEEKYYKNAMKRALKITKGDEMHAKALIRKDSAPEPLSHALHNVKNLMKTSIKTLEKETGRPVVTKVFLTSDVLHRDSISPNYKKSREGVVRPTHLASCKEYLQDRWGAEIVPGLEADDLIAINHEAAGGKDVIIMSIDKDLRQLPGSHFDFTKPLLYEVTEDEARRNFWTQVLVGDSTDDIKGLHKVGPVTAKKILDEVSEGADDLQFYRRVVKAYSDRLPREDEESDQQFYTRVIKTIGIACRLLWLSRDMEDRLLWDAPSAHPGH